MACQQEPSIVLITGFKNEDDEVKPKEEEKPADLEKSVKIVVETWALVKQDMLKHGMTFYKRLFTEHPEVKTMFSFFSDINDNVGDNDVGMQHQAKLLMSMIDYATRCLGDLTELVPKLKRLGKRHFMKHKVKPEHFQPVGESLLWTLKEGLGEIYTHDVEVAWSTIYGILADVMIEGGKEAGTEDESANTDNM